MVEMNPKELPIEIRLSNTYIQTEQLITVQFTGYLWERRDSSIQSHKLNVVSSIKKTIHDHMMRGSQNNPFFELNDVQLTHLIKTPEEPIVCPLNENISYNGRKSTLTTS